MKKFLSGSKIYFKDYLDFKPHDTDYILFENNPKLYKEYAHIKERNVDVFAYKDMSKEEFINFIKKRISYDGMQIGTLINTEMCEYLNITIDDLRNIDINQIKLYEKWNYLKMIYNFYLENNGMYLTQEQRD